MDWNVVVIVEAVLEDVDAELFRFGNGAAIGGFGGPELTFVPARVEDVDSSWEEDRHPAV